MAASGGLGPGDDMKAEIQQLLRRGDCHEAMVVMTMTIGNCDPTLMLMRPDPACEKVAVKTTSKAIVCRHGGVMKMSDQCVRWQEMAQRIIHCVQGVLHQCLPEFVPCPRWEQ